MSRPPIQSIELSDNLTLSECHPDSECRTINWWLYDKRAGMNLGIRAPNREEAFVEAIDYWANRFKELEHAHDRLAAQVEAFIKAVRPDEDEEPPF